MTTPDFSFATGDNEWYTPEDVIRFVELLMGRVDVDLCGLSPFWSGDTVSHGTAQGGIRTFTKTTELVGKTVFANPPYGWLPAQYIPKEGVLDFDMKYLPSALTVDDVDISAPVPKRYQDDVEIQLGGFGTIWDMNKKTGQMEHMPILSRVHSAHCFAHYLLKLWQDGVIRQAVVLIPSATDTMGHRKMFKGVGYCINTTQRLKFMKPDGQGGFKPLSGNTKGSSIFWLPPHRAIRCEQDYRDKLDNIASAMGGKLPFEYALTKHIHS